MADAKPLIVKAVSDLREQVPALAGLKLVVELELRGRGDVQLYRVAVDGAADPAVTKDMAPDAKLRVSVPRADFNELVERARLSAWHDAFDSGIARAEGPPQIVKLIQAVVAKQEERDRLRRARSRH